MPSLNILPIVRKEFRQIRRDKRVLGVLLFIPALMLVMFGYALNFDVKHTRLAVYDQDRSRTSREFIEEFFHSELFDLTQYIDHPAQGTQLLDREEARVVLVIPSDFSKKISSGSEAEIQVLIDGANSNAASIVLGYVNMIVQQYSFKVILRSLVRTGGREISLPIDYRPRVWYNPELKSAKFLVPGLIAFILMITAVISTSLAISRERELGTMEQLLVSPIKPIELILGKTIPYTLISLIATTGILVLGYLLFGVTIKGSIFLLFLVTLIFLIGSLGLGLLISTIAETQELAFMIATILTMLPTFILSGFVFPIRNMPVIIQAITYIIPARYFLVSLRSIVIKGVGITAFWDEFLMLILFALIMLIISTVRMKKLLQ
ncbi:MAG: ABC transporter permease [bacterium]